MVPWNGDKGSSKHPLIVDQPWGLLYGRDAVTGATLGIVLPVGDSRSSEVSGGQKSALWDRAQTSVFRQGKPGMN